MLFISYYGTNTSVVDPDPHRSASFWVPGSATASNKNPDLDPHHIKIRIRIRIQILIKLTSWIRNQIWIRINLQMTSQNVWNISPFEHFFRGFEPLFKSQDLDPDPHHSEKSDPDPHQIIIRIRIGVIRRIRICIRILIGSVVEPEPEPQEP